MTHDDEKELLDLIAKTEEEKQDIQRTINYHRMIALNLETELIAVKLRLEEQQEILRRLRYSR